MNKFYTLLVCLILFCSPLIMFAQPANNAFASATDVTALINAACTSSGAYTTIGATADQAKGSCWTNGPNKNVWFKFTATTTTFINVRVKVSGAGETMRYPFVALWTSVPAQLQCMNQVGPAVDLSMSYYGLTTGTTYYISVDTHSGGTYGTFDLCLSDVPDYDYPQGATDVTASLNAGCTSGGLYTTLFATADHSKGSCWNNGPATNRWFKFTATASTFINAQVKVSGAGETMRYPFVALWDASFTQIACQNQNGAAVDISMSYYGLTVGNTYYISVDTHTGGTPGTFDLCVGDVPDYDYPQGAVDVTASINAACATTGVYSTLYASADHAKGTCWNNGPNNNRWFKFTATATTFINAQVKVSGASESMRYPFVALWDASFTQVTCQNQNGAATNISMSYYGLTPGVTYYISVDTHSGGTPGTFDLCLSDVPDYDYPQGAVDLTATINAACGTSGLYNTLYASADHSKGSCWNNGPNYNRWFKFTATATTFINASVKVSGASESMRYPFIAIWDATFTQIACQNQNGAAVDISTSCYGLTPGATYYVSVDTHSGGTPGTFDVCLSDVPDYDYPQGAVDITALNMINAGCTGGGEYSTLYASADHTKGSCWNNGPNYNRWFKFTATATTFISAQVLVSGAGETMRYPFIALWDATFTQIACQNQNGAAVDITMSYYGLTVGNTYYISIDTHSGGTPGTFDVCFTDQPDYDYPQGAVDVTAAMNGCTSGGTYSTLYASADHAKGSCWNNGPNYNRWFKFTASATTFVNAQVVVSGGQTMRYPFLAIWDASFTQIACQNQNGAATDISTSYYGLTPGATYYISVDTHSGGTPGSFDLCLSDQPDYDYPQGAVTLTNLNNFCSTGGLYTTVNASADHSKGSCWNNGPNYNRWFKFTAIYSTTTIQVKVNTNTMRYPFVALWNTSFTQLSCTNQAGAAVDITLNYASLVPGTTYYISVDTHSGGTPGTFDICINDASSVQYYSIGDGDWSNSANWSTTGFGGITAGTTPAIQNIVNIQDHAITVSSAQAAAEIDITTGTTAASNLTVDAATLTVSGKLIVGNTGNNRDVIVNSQNGALLAVTDNATFTRSGGANDFQLNIGNGSSMTVGQDMIWTSSAGTVKTNQLNLNGSGTLTVARDLTLSSTGGMQILHSLNNTSSVTVGRDITFSANAAGLAQIALNNTSNLSLKRNFVRSVSSYGILNCASGATLTFNGGASTQNMLGSTGTGGDGFTYSNVVINNTGGSVFDVTLTGAASMSGALTLTSGLLKTTSANLLTLTPTASSTIGTSATTSYVSGPLAIQKISSGSSVLNFPIGKIADSRPVALTINHSDNTLYAYQAEVFNASANALGYTLPATIDTVSYVHYWTIGRTDAVGTTQSSAGLVGNQTIQLFFGSSDNVTDGANLAVVKNTSAFPSTWFDIGGSGAPAFSGGANLVGSVTSTSAPTAFTSFSTFTLGSKLTGWNGLPIELLSFTAEADGNNVDLKWSTATETKNHFFTIEKSRDAISFVPFQQVDSKALNGNSTSPLNYKTVDTNPFDGMNYYRLKQTDYNGNYKYFNIVSVSVKHKGNVVFNLYPNPNDAKNSTTLEISGMEDNSSVSISMFDLLGKEVFSKTHTTSGTGSNLISINPINKLSAGVYFVTVKNPDNDAVLYKQKLIIR
jgi:hypothetical protein